MEEYHAEIVAIIETSLALRTVVFPVTKGVHMLLGCPQATEGACTRVTFRHDEWNIWCLLSGSSKSIVQISDLLEDGPTYVQ